MFFFSFLVMCTLLGTFCNAPGFPWHKALRWTMLLLLEITCTFITLSNDQIQHNVYGMYATFSLRTALKPILTQLCFSSLKVTFFLFKHLCTLTTSVFGDGTGSEHHVRETRRWNNTVYICYALLYAQYMYYYLLLMKLWRLSFKFFIIVSLVDLSFYIISNLPKLVVNCSCN